MNTRTPSDRTSSALVLTDLQIWPVRNSESSRVKAMASLTFNGALKVNSCRIIEGSKGLFLAFPSDRRQGTDQFFPICSPINREIGDKVQKEVIQKFQSLQEASV
jgi:stage V sporulation protein G